MQELLLQKCSQFCTFPIHVVTMTFFWFKWDMDQLCGTECQVSRAVWIFSASLEDLFAKIASVAKAILRSAAPHVEAAVEAAKQHLGEAANGIMKEASTMCAKLWRVLRATTKKVPVYENESVLLKEDQQTTTKTVSTWNTRLYLIESWFSSSEIQHQPWTWKTSHLQFLLHTLSGCGLSMEELDQQPFCRKRIFRSYQPFYSSQQLRTTESGRPGHWAGSICKKRNTARQRDFIDDANEVAPANDSIHSLFASVHVTLGNRLMSDASTYYPHRAYLKTLPRYSEGPKSHSWLPVGLCWTRLDISMWPAATWEKRLAKAYSLEDSGCSYQKRYLPIYSSRASRWLLAFR